MSGSLLLVPIYKYSDDIHYVVEFNDTKRHWWQKRNQTDKITKNVVRGEVELYLINGIETDDMSKLEFIANSDLNLEAMWESQILINTAIGYSNIKALEFILSKQDKPMDWLIYIDNIIRNRGFGLNYASTEMIIHLLTKRSTSFIELLEGFSYDPQLVKYLEENKFMPELAKKKFFSAASYSNIIKSLYNTNNYSNESIVTTMEILSKYLLKSMTQDQKNQIIYATFRQTCNCPCQITDPDKAYEKIKILLAQMIRDGCDPGAIDFTAIIQMYNARMRENLLNYLVDLRVDFSKETTDGRNLLYLIEEQIDHAESVPILADGITNSQINYWKRLHDLVQSRTALKSAGVDNDNLTPRQRNQKNKEKK